MAAGVLKRQECRTSPIEIVWNPLAIWLKSQKEDRQSNGTSIAELFDEGVMVKLMST
jgi:hypothetical protein